jgi:hypothetical protein
MGQQYTADYPLPGGVEQYYVSLLKILHHVRDTHPTYDELVTWIGRTFGVTGSAAVTGYLGSVSKAGLISTKDEAVQPTTDGLTLLDLADESDARARAEVLRLKVRDIAGYDFLMKFMRENGPQTFDVLNTSLKHAMNVDWQSVNQTMFRLNWLRSLGYVRFHAHQYDLTDEGRAIATDLAAPASAAPAAPAESKPTVRTRLADRANEIAERLTRAAVEGGTGEELEHATSEAFAFLGFVTQHIGGSGNPDLIATAPMGPSRYRLLVETKSRASGVVNQNDVNFQALNGHKAKAGADHTVVIAADFAGGNLEAWAREQSVRLLRIDDLQRVLLAHAEAALPLDMIRPLFTGGGSTDETVLTTTLTTSENTKLSMALARKVYDAVHSYQEEEAPLDPHSLYFILSREYPLQSIEAAVSLLSSDVLCALGRTPRGGLYTRMTPGTLHQKLRQFLDIVGAANPATPLR